MSFPGNKSAHEDLSQSALNLQLSRKSASAPAFRPQIMRSVRMHPVIAASVAAMVLVGLVGFAMVQKPVYLAVSQVYEEPAPPKLLSDPSAAVFDANKYETFLAEQIQLVQRLDVLTAAMGSLPAATYQEFGATPAQAAEAIQSQIKVVRLASSYQISIGLKGNDPQKTADLVNAITTAYLGTVHKANAADYDQRAQLLGEERQRIETELQTERAEQTALGASIGVANPVGESGNPYDAELSGIRAQLVEARAAHDVASAQLASLSGAGQSRTDGLTAAADELIAGDAGLGSMKATISQRKAQLNEQMSGMTPNNPIYKQDQDQIADLDRTLDRMTNDLRDKAARRLQDKLRADLQRTGDIESRLNGQLARQIANATSAAPRLQRASEVAADMQRLDTRMAAVDDSLRSLRLEVSGPPQVRLSLAATAPERPEANRRKQLLLLALPLALLFGAAAAILARKRHKRIYGPVDIDDVLGFSPLAVLPARADVSQQVFEEYVLRLAAGIESAYRTTGARTFLLTSVSLTTDIGPLATALTRKFEEIGVHVIVATAWDMLAPTEGVPAGDSNTDPATAGELAKAVARWNEGFVTANVARMKTENGLVLIESDAILNCAQTEYVARCADATVLIVECGVTTRPELFRAAELLHRLNVTGIAAVLEEIQLRYADANFRNAIDALDRRQSASVQPDRRARHQVPAGVLSTVLSAVDIVPQEPIASVAVAQTPAIPAVTPVEEIAQDPSLLETEEDRVELEYEPAHYHEVLHHVRATRPSDHDEGWQLPVFDQVPPQPIPTAEAAVAPLAEVVQPANSDVVENTSHTGPLVLENTLSEGGIDAANDSLHEKMTSRLSARGDQPAPDGEPGMTRKSSWIGKLLRRDSAPIVSIIHGAGDDVPDDAVPETDLPTSPFPMEPAAENDYDVSLAHRLSQISGSWAAHASTAATDIATFKESHRLKILPLEPVESDATHAVRETLTDTAVVEPEALEPVAEIAARVRKGPAAWVTAGQSFGETAGIIGPPTLPMAPPNSPDGPRRPPTFQELIALTARRTTPPADVPPVDRAEPEPIPEPIPETPYRVLGHVSEYVPAVPTIEAEAAEPEVELHAADVAKSVEHGAEPPTIEEVIPEIAAHAVETAPEPVHEPVPAFEALPEQAWAEDPTPQPISEPMADEVPEFHFSDRYLEESKRLREEIPAFDPYRPNLYELDDIEPVYQEASRNLNTGRWDPIPPLRPSMNSWRDRPSPMPANASSARHYKDAAVKDAFNSYPPQRWIPEDTPPVPPEPEPLSEPMLSRQWGLLSKFQQSRLTSSSRPAAGSEGATDSGRDEDRPGSPRGDHRS